MSYPRVFITRQIGEAALQPLLAVADVEVWPGQFPPDASILLEKIPDLDGLLCLLTDPIDRALMIAGTHLKVISQMAVGCDNIDISAATALKIPIGHTPGVLTEATADLTWALLMAASRRIVEAEQFTRSGQWQTWEPNLLLGADLTGATLGIVGLGRIGQAVARRAQGFQMRVLYHNRQPCDPTITTQLQAEFTDFDTLLAESDFVTLHTPLSANTYHLFKREQFQQMKPSAILINTARGGIVDPDALYQALITGEIAGAALDVTEPEPIPLDHPLLTLKNLIITPHIGSASYQTRSRMAQMAVENLLAGLTGKQLPYCFNPEVYG